MDGEYGTLGEAGGPGVSTDGGQNFFFTGESAIRFDADEKWILDAGTGGFSLEFADVTFYEVAVHELGHALGLDHSDNNTTLMFPNLGGVGYRCNRPRYPGYIDPLRSGETAQFSPPDIARGQCFKHDQ